MIVGKELAASLAATMSNDDKRFFIHLFESGSMTGAKSLVHSKAKKHAFEQQLIGSHALTSSTIQNGLIDITYGLLNNKTKLKINDHGEVIEVAL